MQGQLPTYVHLASRVHQIPACAEWCFTQCLSLSKNDSGLSQRMIWCGTVAVLSLPGLLFLAFRLQMPLVTNIYCVLCVGEGTAGDSPGEADAQSAYDIVKRNQLRRALAATLSQLKQGAESVQRSLEAVRLELVVVV